MFVNYFKYAKTSFTLTKSIRSFPSLERGEKEVERERNNNTYNNRETIGVSRVLCYQQADIAA